MRCPGASATRGQIRQAALPPSALSSPPAADGREMTAGKSTPTARNESCLSFQSQTNRGQKAVSPSLPLSRERGRRAENAFGPSHYINRKALQAPQIPACSPTQVCNEHQPTVDLSNYDASKRVKLGGSPGSRRYFCTGSGNQKSII